MNTRLQVEHPVTELITGLDLVEIQIRIAMGEPLRLQQHDITLRGHAIECRIYAEDPENNFMPSPGKITRFLQPGGPGVREDCGVYEGWTVPLDYDPMLSKLITYGATRENAIEKMLRALDEYTIGGIRTNISLFRRILSDDDFRKAAIDTGYLERLLSQPQEGGSGEIPQEVIALAAAILTSAHKTREIPAPPSTPSRWKLAGREEGLRA
jgi:acetyl-CoA carboxylase biotin carboxylase subunit